MGSNHGRRTTSKISASLELLCQACQTLDLAETLAARIAAEGATIKSSYGLKSHPAVKDLLGARALVCRTLARLGVLEEPVRAVGPGPRHKKELSCSLPRTRTQNPVSGSAVAYPGEHKAIVDEELWRVVQDRLAANRTIRRKSRIETGALLGGLIYDDRGNIMSPTYSIRRGNRYRYYISSALLHDRRPDAGSLARINADDVERLVVAVLGRELSRPELLADGPSAGWSAETRTLVRETVERVVIQSGQVQITRRPAATSAAGDPPRRRRATRGRSM